MAKRKLIWKNDSIFDLKEIMNYYEMRNKSKTYSNQLFTEIKKRLKKLDFSIAFPKKTSDEKLFYFTYNHILVGFEIYENDIKVLLIVDERRNPEMINKMLQNLNP